MYKMYILKMYIIYVHLETAALVIKEAYMKLDIIIINSSHFTSKKNNQIYNTIDFILSDKDAYIKTDKFVGYSITTSFINKNVLNDIEIMTKCQGIFEEKTYGLKKSLILKQLVLSNGKTIDLL